MVAGPATPDELAVLAVGGVNTTFAARRADQVALHRLSTTDGAYSGRILFPSDSLTKSNNALNAPIRNAALRRSVDGRFLLFNGGRGAAGLSNQDLLNATAVRIAADGTWTDQRLGTTYMTSGEGLAGVVSVDGARKWLGINHTTKPIATLAEGDTELTQVGAFPVPTVPVTSIDLVDGSLVVTGVTGVSRLPGGLPTAQDTTTPPQLFIAAPSALDATFVDTDGVAGADTAYVVRDGRGVWKFVLDAGTWKSRGSVGGSYGYVTARAVAGAVEVYLTTANTAKLVKLVDTAEIGGEVKTTGVSTLAYAPARARYTGLAFAPTGGFPADGTAYPATAPAITASATTVDTHIGAATKGAVTLEVFDPNTTDITVTATSSNQTVLPNGKIAIGGHGRRAHGDVRPARDRHGYRDLHGALRRRRRDHHRPAEASRPRSRIRAGTTTPARSTCRPRSTSAGTTSWASRTRSTPSTCSRRASAAARSRPGTRASRAARPTSRARRASATRSCGRARTATTARAPRARSAASSRSRRSPARAPASTWSSATATRACGSSGRTGTRPTAMAWARTSSSSTRPRSRGCSRTRRTASTSRA